MDIFAGAYLEIKTRKMTIVTEARGCGEGHKILETGNYCPECGQALFGVSVKKDVYPPAIVDYLLPDEWEDVLSEITPNFGVDAGVILAIGNKRMGGEWGYFRADFVDNDIVFFPRDAEQDNLVREFTIAHGDILLALGKSKYVAGLSIKTGMIARRW